MTNIKIIIFAFVFSSCSLLKPDDSQIIASQAFNQSKDVAMEMAYRDALKKIDQLGCNQDKGKGNVTYKRSGGGYVAEARYVVSKVHCQKTVNCLDQEWIKEETRTQGGGWVWFKGKGLGKTREEADKLAKEESLRHMAIECNISEKTFRFVERCEEYSGNHFIVYARASIKSEKCAN